MAEITDTNQAEPSMEEILASIRKIIADDGAPASGAAAEEVIELTQLVEDDGSVIDLADPEPEPAPPPPPPVAATPPRMPTPPPLPASQLPKPMLPPEKLVSEPAETATLSSLSSLADTVAIERLSAIPPSHSYIGNGGRTLEDLVLELMRPLLKDWLDKNLPATVDRLVQAEIERISRRAKD